MSNPVHSLPITPNKKVIAHRGASALRPENTLTSFIHAIELGANWIEFDVQLTSCQNWVVFHDETISRTTNDSGKLTDLSLAEIKQLDAGNWFAAKYQGEQVPTLIEVMNLADKFNLQANIELKIYAKDYKTYIESFAGYLTQNMSKWKTKPLVSSFCLTALKYLRKLMPELPIGYLVESFASDTCSIAVKNSFNSIHCNVEYITANDFATAKEHDLLVLLYTVNDAATANKWLNAGAYAVFTDDLGMIGGL